MYPHLSLSILVSLCISGVACADLFLPAGLNPGDKYRIVFVTSGMRDANATGLFPYNSFVDDAANAIGTLTEPLNATWKAIASTASKSAIDNTDTDPSAAGVPVFLVDGTTQIATGNADLWDGSIAAAINKDEFGSFAGGEFVWTGTNSSGTVDFSGLGGPLGATVGYSGHSAGGLWVDFSFLGPDTSSSQRFYGISSELTAVPEPGVFAYLGAVGLGLAGFRLVKKALNS